MKTFFLSKAVVLGLAVSACGFVGTATHAAGKASSAEATTALPADSGETALMSGAKEFGWGVEKLDDGSVVLYPPAMSQGGTPKASESESPAAPVTVREARQWRTKRLADGSLILYQPTAANTAPESGQDGESLDDEAKKELEGRGWGLRLSDDGTVEFHPLSQGAEAR